MLDLSHIPTPDGTSDIQVFAGTSDTAGGAWQTRVKPRGKTMLNIILIGKGGSGGNSSGGSLIGGQAGSAGGQSIITIPLAFVPDRLYLSLANVGPTNNASYISVAPNTTANNRLVFANGGTNGASNTDAATAATAAATAAQMPLGWAFQDSILTGQGAVNTLTNQPLPVTGNLSSAGSTGAVGITGAGEFPSIAGAPVNTNGDHGITIPARTFMFFYGGVGGGGDNPTATTSGTGSYGAGGGGGGLSSGATNLGAFGGPALAILTCW